MPATIEAFVIFLIFIVPGVVATRALKGVVPFAFQSQIEFVVLSLIISLVIHLSAAFVTVDAVWLPLLSIQGGSVIGNISNLDYSVIVLWLSFILFVAPLFLGYLLGELLRQGKLQSILGKIGLSHAQLTPTAWDWFFMRQEGCWVVAEFADGRRIGGVYEYRSLASLSPHKRDLFLEREYAVQDDMTIGDEVPNSNGLWINGDSIRSLHFFKVKEESDA